MKDAFLNECLLLLKREDIKQNIKELIDTWLAYKRETEVDELRQRPHPHEFFLYYDI